MTFLCTTFMNMLASFSTWLKGTTDGRVLGLFRIVFGLFMTYYCLYYHNAQFIKQGLLAPVMHFKYDGFEWLGLLPEPAMQGLLFAMGVAALLITIGVGMRYAALFYMLGLSYFTFVEKAYFNNHIYMFILLCFLFSFTDADRFLSLRGNGGYGKLIPRWQIFLLQLQVCLVYFYGGLAKLAPDWLLHQEPMRTMVSKYMGYNSEVAAYFLTYVGLLIDLAAPVLLFYKPLRKWAVLGFGFFHLSNSQLFNDIGIFPFVMLSALILYFETHEIPFLRDLNTESAPKRPTGKPGKSGVKPVEQPVLRATAPASWVTGVLIVYWVWQFLFPFRGFFLPNPLDYSTIGNRFSWRMKIDTRGFEETAYYVSFPDKQGEKQIKIDSYLNPMQIRLLAMDPRAAADFAHYLREDAIRRGAPVPIIKARIKFSYNGRPPGYFVDPERDLSTATYSAFKKIDWLLPLQ